VCQWGQILHIAEQYWLPDMDLNLEEAVFLVHA